MTEKSAEQSRPPQSQSLPGDESRMRPAPKFDPLYRGSSRLQGKSVLITGGDSGIGRACAALFAREGADVAIVYLSEDGDAETTAKIVESEGGRALTLRGDIRSKKRCQEIVDATVSAFGRIDVLINNAAEQHSGEFLEISDDQLAGTFSTNVFGYFYTTQAALPNIPAGGAIINTASVTAFRGSERLIDYAATRGAIVAFTRSLAKYCLPKRVRVNCVAPGPVWTPLIPASFSAEEVAEFGSDAPLGRAGEPYEIAPCYLFLACGDSSYMTGQTLHPNGGEIVGA